MNLGFLQSLFIFGAGFFLPFFPDGTGPLLRQTTPLPDEIGAFFPFPRRPRKLEKTKSGPEEEKTRNADSHPDRPHPRPPALPLPFLSGTRNPPPLPPGPSVLLGSFLVRKGGEERRERASELFVRLLGGSGGGHRASVRPDWPFVCLGWRREQGWQASERSSGRMVHLFGRKDGGGERASERGRSGVPHEFRRGKRRGGVERGGGGSEQASPCTDEVTLDRPQIGMGFSVICGFCRLRLSQFIMNLSAGTFTPDGRFQPSSGFSEFVVSS